jgi:hypothetical protein
MLTKADYERNSGAFLWTVDGVRIVACQDGLFSVARDPPAVGAAEDAVAALQTRDS